jgi:hypothetical protein
VQTVSATIVFDLAGQAKCALFESDDPGISELVWSGISWFQVPSRSYNETREISFDSAYGNVKDPSSSRALERNSTYYMSCIASDFLGRQGNATRRPYLLQTQKIGPPIIVIHDIATTTQLINVTVSVDIDGEVWCAAASSMSALIPEKIVSFGTNATRVGNPTGLRSVLIVGTIGGFDYLMRGRPYYVACAAEDTSGEYGGFLSSQADVEAIATVVETAREGLPIIRIVDVLPAMRSLTVSALVDDSSATVMCAATSSDDAGSLLLGADFELNGFPAQRKTETSAGLVSVHEITSAADTEEALDSGEAYSVYCYAANYTDLEISLTRWRGKTLSEGAPTVDILNAAITTQHIALQLEMTGNGSVACGAVPEFYMKPDPYSLLRNGAAGVPSDDVPGTLDVAIFTSFLEEGYDYLRRNRTYDVYCATEGGGYVMTSPRLHSLARRSVQSSRAHP